MAAQSAKETAPKVSVPMASRQYYLAHRRAIEGAVAVAVKSIMETEPEDPIAGLALHFAQSRSSSVAMEAAAAPSTSETSSLRRAIALNSKSSPFGSMRSRWRASTRPAARR